MEFLPERVARDLVALPDAIEAVERAFRALSDGEAELYPVVLCNVGDDGSRFGMKSGRLGRELMGPKLGAYWPSNHARGLPSHASSVILLDPETGVPMAMIGAGHLNVLRTAAADAVAVRALAPATASRVSLIGAGRQGLYEVRAVAAVRKVEVVFVWSRNEAASARVAATLREDGLDARVASREAACREAEILITATSAREPLVERAWVRPGAHVSAMGADGPGKQELAVDLVGAATLFADNRAQSLTIGEFEAARAAGAITADQVREIGDVLTGRVSGRASADEVTIFDSSGVAAQDLVIAGLALAEGRARGLAIDVS